MSNKVTELLKQMRDAIKNMTPEEVRALYDAKKHEATEENVAAYAYIEKMVMINSHSFKFESDTQIAFTINHVVVSTNKISLAAESNDYSYAMAA